MQSFRGSLVIVWIKSEIQFIGANDDGAVVHKVTIGEGSHPENVKVYGPGVEKTGLKANEPTYFTVDCSEAGQGEPRFMSCVLVHDTQDMILSS